MWLAHIIIPPPTSMFFVVVEVLYYKIDDKSVSFIVVKPCDKVYLVCVANLTLLLLLQVATTIS